MIRYFTHQRVKYFSLRDFHNTLMPKGDYEPQAEAQIYILANELRVLKNGGMVHPFFVLPENDWFIHWVQFEHFRPFYAKSTFASAKRLFQMIDYAEGKLEGWNTFFSEVECPKLIPVVLSETDATPDLGPFHRMKPSTLTLYDGSQA